MNMLLSKNKRVILLEVIGLQIGLITVVMIINYIIDVYLNKHYPQISAYLLIVTYICFLTLMYLFIVNKKIHKSQIGFSKIQFTKQNVSTYFIVFIPLVFGILTVWELYEYLTILYIILMILVGAIEEVLFRGLLKYVCMNQSKICYVLLSSTLFSLAHVFVNTENMIFLLLSTFLIGIMLALFFLVQESIYPLIIYHILHNVVFFIPIPLVTSGMYYLLNILTIFYLSYILIKGIKAKGI